MGIKMVNRRCSVAPTNPGWVALILYTAAWGVFIYYLGELI